MENGKSRKVDLEGKLSKYSNHIKGALKKIFLNRTDKCKHTINSSILNSIHPACGKDMSCFFNCTLGFVQAALKIFSLKAAITLLQALIKRKNLLKSFQSVFTKDSLTLSMYVGLMVGLYKLTICVLRTVTKSDDKTNAIIAGIVSSLSTFADNSEDRRKSLILFFFVRSIETSINYSNSHNSIKISEHTVQSVI